MPRFHCPAPLSAGASLALPPGAARHVQVLRLQPGAVITLFNGDGGEWDAVIERMGRSEVQVQVQSHRAIEREAGIAIHLAVAIPANERMDWLVEKAAELGAASIQPLLTSRSVLRPTGERAAKKQAHWQAIAAAACEQCGRNRVPPVHEVREFAAWPPTGPGVRLVLSLGEGAQPLASWAAAPGPVLVLSGPEGGLAPAEEEAARAQGFVPASLGERVLRAETAPLAVLAALTLGR
jgi:16S rRNA (uracil1498-N3)-methyltransferase